MQDKSEWIDLADLGKWARVLGGRRGRFGMVVLADSINGRVRTDGLGMGIQNSAGSVSTTVKILGINTGAARTTSRLI